MLLPLLPVVVVPGLVVVPLLRLGAGQPALVLYLPTQPA